MYTVKFNYSYNEHRYPNFNSLIQTLEEDYSHKIVNDVREAFQKNKCKNFENKFFTIYHAIGYLYNDEYYASLYDLALALAGEVDQGMKVEWFIQNIGVCARKDNGDEIELPWYDMIDDDYDHREYGGNLADTIDEEIASEIMGAIEDAEELAEDGCFVLSFWEESFNIEIEEEEGDED